MDVMGFNDAGMIVAEIGGFTVTVPDDPGNWHRQLIAIEWEGVGNVIAAYVPPAPPAYRLYKSVFIARMVEDEAVAMETVLAAADAKLRLLFNSVEYFVSDDPLFGTLRAAVGNALGEERATALLAVE